MLLIVRFCITALCISYYSVIELVSAFNCTGFLSEALCNNFISYFMYNTEIHDSKESVKVNYERKIDILSTCWLTHNSEIATITKYFEITVFVCGFRNAAELLICVKGVCVCGKQN